MGFRGPLRNGRRSKTGGMIWAEQGREPGGRSGAGDGGRSGGSGAGTSAGNPAAPTKLYKSILFTLAKNGNEAGEGDNFACRNRGGSYNIFLLR